LGQQILEALAFADARAHLWFSQSGPSEQGLKSANASLTQYPSMHKPLVHISLIVSQYVPTGRFAQTVWSNDEFPHTIPVATAVPLQQIVVDVA
jgi:hypothetical protein